MKTFVDKSKGIWPIDINVSAVRRIKKKTGHDVLRLIESVDGRAPLLQILLMDPMEAAGVLWSVCEPTAKERQLDEDAFGELLDGATFAAGKDALIDDLVTFFTESGRKELANAVGKIREEFKTGLEQVALDVEAAGNSAVAGLEAKTAEAV